MSLESPAPQFRPAERAIYGLARFGAERPRTALMVFGMLSLFGVGLASQLTIESDYASLLPRDAIETVDLRELEAHVPGAWQVVVAIDGPGEPAQTQKLAQGLGEELAKLPEVAFVQSQIPTTFFDNRALLFADPEELAAQREALEDAIAQRKAEANPMYVDLLSEDEQESPELRFAELERSIRAKLPAEGHQMSADGRYVFILLEATFPPTRIDKSEHFFASLTKRIDDYRASSGGNFETRFAGPHFSHMQEEIEIARDVQVAALLGAGLVIAVLLLATRSWRALPLVLVPLSSSIAITFGFAYLALGHLNIVSGFLVTILFGLGIDFGVHTFLRHVELGAQASNDLADKKVYAEAAVATGRACWTSASTTALAFLTLIFADFRGFSEFGLIASVGVTAAFVSNVILFPALGALLGRSPRSRRRVAAASNTVSFVRRSLAALLGQPLATHAIATGFVALTLVGAHAATKVEFQGDLESLRGASRHVRFDQLVNQALGGQTAPTLIAANDQRAENFARTFLEQRSVEMGIERILSAADFVPVVTARGEDELSALAQTLADPWLDELDGDERQELDEARALVAAKPYGRSDLPQEVRRWFEHDTGKPLLIVHAQDGEPSVDQMILWSKSLEELRAEARKRGHEVRVLSGTAIAGRLFRLIFQDGPYILWATLLAVFVVLLLDRRNFFTAALLWFAVAASLILTAASMKWLGIELNIFNALIFPCLVGISVDAAVHVEHRFGAASTNERPRAWQMVASSTWWASLTTGIGFGALMVARHHGIFSIGLVATLGITLAWLIAVLVVPCATLTTQRKDLEPCVESPR